MIVLKSPSEIAKMAQAGKIVAGALARLERMVRPGVTTRELDRAAEDFIVQHGAKPAFKGYRNFPATLCASVNEQVVHGIPSDRKLETGDIIGLDLGAIVDGYYGDSAITVAVGDASPEALRLIEATREALARGIAQIAEGKRLSDISHAVQTHAESFGYSVVRDFVGHGIGRQLHEEPQIPNYGPAGRGPRLKVGMVLAIEPMVNVGGPAVRVLQDQWTAVTADGSLSAHFEHTIALTESGPVVLTQR
jgi:methionyl aminopeptidase